MNCYFLNMAYFYASQEIVLFLVRAWHLLSHKQLMICYNLLIKSSGFLVGRLFTVFSLCLYISLFLLNCLHFSRLLLQLVILFWGSSGRRLFCSNCFCVRVELPALLYLVHKKMCTLYNPVTESIKRYEKQCRQWRNLTWCSLSNGGRLTSVENCFPSCISTASVLD